LGTTTTTTRQSCSWVAPGRARGGAPRHRIIRPVAALLLLLACGDDDDGSRATATADTAAPSSPGAGDSARAASSGVPTRTEMRDVALGIMEGVTLHVTYLSGRALPLHEGVPVTLDDPTTYRLEIDTAATRIGYDDLARLMNDHVFAYEGAPLSDLVAEREHDEGEEVRLELKGVLTSAALAFEIEGVPAVTDEGLVRIEARSIQAAEIDVGGLMDLFGIETEDLADMEEALGIEVDGNDLILDPARLLPPPRASGRVTHVALDPEGMVMHFGHAANGRAGTGTPERDRPEAPYLSYRGGTVKLGRMTMTDADLLILDADGSDAFHFRPPEMNRQVAAGYVKVRLDGGLVIRAPDYASADSTDLRPAPGR